MTVFRAGSAVMLKDDLHARVLQVSIGQGDAVQYQVVWWDGRNRVVQWVDAFEVKAAEASESRAVGFLGDAR